MGMKTLLMVAVLVLVLLLLWYVVANNVTAQAQLTSIGVAQYVPSFPCPSTAQTAGYCDTTGVWHMPPAAAQAMLCSREGFSPKLMHVAGSGSAN